MYNATGLINHAKSINQLFIFIIVQYRIAGYSFIPGKEIINKGFSNAGLLN